MLTAALAVAMSGQSAARAEPLRPSANWVVDYADEMCTLGREFGSDKVTFGIRPSALGTGGGLAVVMIPGAAPSRSHETSATLVLEDASTIDVDASIYWLSDQKMRVVTVSLDGDQMGKVMSGRPFGFPVGRREHIWFAPDSVSDALKVLKGCETDLLVSLGVPADELAQVAVGPTGDVARAFGSSAYPSNALFRGKNGRTFALVTVGADGRAEACKIVSNSGHESFRKGTCDAVMRARFEPGRNAAGEPVRAWYPLRVTWQTQHFP